MIGRRVLIGGGFVEITIATSVRSPDIRSLAVARGWQPYQRIVCTINAGVNVATLGVSGFQHDQVSIICRGVIGGVAGGLLGGPLAGGVGLNVVGQRISVQNAGTIFGGGGGGQAGGSASATQPGGGTVTASGGSGGRGAGFTFTGPVALLGKENGYPGETVMYSGAVFPGDPRVQATGYAGGNGGAYGTAATSSTDGRPGGAGGAAVSGNSLINWISLGTISGARIG